MVIDSSALIALLLGEPETLIFVAAIAATPRRLVSMPTSLEAAIVMVSRSGAVALEKLDRLLVEPGVELVPFSHEHAVLAIDAFCRFGKGSGHAAGLNFGDCFTYALAKLANEPVLFKGGDFSRTDLASALGP
jgi:ribonuclease VapC